MGKPGYSEEDGLIVLRLQPDDYTHLMLILRYAAGRLKRSAEGVMTHAAVLELTDRLTEGRPSLRPYQTGKPRGFA